MTRKTNPEIIAEFAALLAGEKTIEHFNNASKYLGIERHAILDATQAWRSELWKKLKECKERMCPRPPDPPPDRFIDRGTGL